MPRACASRSSQGGEVFLKGDELSQQSFAAAGSSPFIYVAKGRPMTTSFWRLPATAHAEADELRRWAALGLEASAARGRGQGAKASQGEENLQVLRTRSPTASSAPERSADMDSLFGFDRARAPAARAPYRAQEEVGDMVAEPDHRRVVVAASDARAAAGDRRRMGRAGPRPARASAAMRSRGGRSA